MKAKVAIVGEFDPKVKAMAATEPAIRFSARYLGYEVESRWISSEDIDGVDLGEFGGIWLAAGAKYVSFDATMQLIEIVRENSIPCIGTCRGYQYMVLEFARNVLGVPDAAHAEEDPDAEHPFVTVLPPAARKTKRQVCFDEGTPVSPAYPRDKAIEMFFGRYGVNPAVEPELQDAGFVSMASEYAGRYRIGGIPKHPFYVGTMFVPQMRATSDAPHPLITTFVKVALMKEMAKAASAR